MNKFIIFVSLILAHSIAQTSASGSAMIVSVSEVGLAWGFKPGTSYTEIFSLQIVGAEIVPSAVPISAMFWLLGSGLMGLIGFARKNR